MRLWYSCGKEIQIACEWLETQWFFIDSVLKKLRQSLRNSGEGSGEPEIFPVSHIVLQISLRDA